MEENHKHPHPVPEQSTNIIVDGQNSLDSGKIIAISILVGAVLVSASLFYNTKVLVNKLGGSEVLGATAVAGQQQNQGQAQGQQNPTAGSPVTVTGRVGAPILGNVNAKVTMVEFSDFQCPFCKAFFGDAEKQIKTNYIDTGKVKLIYRHFPLSIHQNAEKAAEAAECANQQGKFFPYHDVLFTKGQADGTNLDTTSLKQYAKDLGLNTGQFNNCLDTGATAEIVKKDMADGQAAGVSGTPTFYINGVQLVGAMPFSNFKQTIDAALK